ncbi:PilZ domain-containing protein [Virgibacillus sp. W0430]|uniref:PilZ domain-containing protein n=1 Tax=Virgibacillus sp. W0430 TaxID=3391580 RepID=UPI003F447372
MKYRRNDLFRYTFIEPVSALFSIEFINNKRVALANGEAKLLDISLEGLKLYSKLFIPKANERMTYLTITFTLNERELKLPGKLIWHKQVKTGHNYGVQLQLIEVHLKYLLEELRDYSKKGLFIIE